MYEPNSYLNELPVQSTELQDLLMCESLFDEFTMENDLNNNDLNTTQSQAAELSDFETQIQAILAANKNDFGGSNDIYNQNFNNFQYSISTPPDSGLFDSSEMLPSISSPDSFLGSPNSYTTFDDNCSLVTPPQIDPLQDFTMSPDDAILQDFGYSSPLDQLLMSKDDLDTLNLATTQQIDKIKKRVDSTFDRDSLSPDRSLKKKRKGPNVGIGKPVKKSSTGPTVPNMMRNNGITQSIIVPSSPAILASNQGAWNRSAQTINPSVTSFASGGIIDQFSNVPLLAARDGSPTPKLPINRLKTTIASSQPQQNSLSQPNKQQKKVAHNAIERRYRNNINNRINELKNVVPALCHLKSKDDEEVEEVDGIPAATKLNKATILGKATEYINHLKNNNQKLKNENDTLRKLIQVIPGGVELYNTYITEHVQTPPDTDESSSDTSHPNSPHHGSRALMALFMCMTFFTSSSSYITQSHPVDHHHHHEGRVMTGSSTPEIDPAKSSFNINDGTLTIDVWYLTRVLTFLMCLTYVLRPSMFSFSSQSHRARKPKSIITSVLNAKTKDARELYQSLSRFSNGLPVNLLEVIIGLISESIKFVLRKFLGRDITGGGHSLIDAEERLTEVALWGRIGEVEMCGGNDKISRLSILYTCLRTINLLESSYTTRKFIYLSYSRIYANAALQCYIGLSSFPFLAEKAASHFWRLANKEKRHGNGMEEKWLKIALNCDQQGEIWKRVVNRIGDHILRKKNEEKSRTELMKHITIPLTLVTDVQALIYLKQTFANFVSTKSNGKKESSSKNQKSFSFAELIRETTPNSLTHWYALVGCSVEEFSLGNNGLGESFVNRLKDYPTIKSDENDYNKQIIAMGLLSYALLMHGKVEASIRCADKVSLSITKRKDQQRDGDGNVGGKMELLDELNSFEMVSMIQDVHDLAEFCVGRIVLEARCLSWKIIEGLISSTNALNETMKSSSEEKENVPTKSSTKTANTTKKSATTLPDVLDSESLQTTIILWIRYLRRLLKNSVFEDIERNREIKKLVILERIVSGDYDDSEDDLEPSNCECEESSNCQHKHKHNDNSRSLNNENENRAIKAWSILKGI